VVTNFAAPGADGTRGPVLVTGAAGLVGRMLTAGLGDRFDLRLTDRRPGPGIVEGDLRDPVFATSVSAGAAAVVHLAANADPEVAWAGLRGPNADATVAVLDAARAAGTAIVVLASSLHAVGGHADAGRTGIGPDLLPHPCCAYGASKVLGEALGRVYADRHGMSVRCLRLGGVYPVPMARSWLGGWLSPGDLVRLLTAALTADVRYGVYHATSANSAARFDIGRTRTELGYEPADDSAVHEATVPDDSVDDPRLLHRY
jgi:nucleoside-diphosphate-sugar epimerase